MNFMKIYCCLIVIFLISLLSVSGQEIAMHHAETIYYEMHDCDSVIFTGKCQNRVEPQIHQFVDQNFQIIELNAGRLDPSSLVLTVSKKPWWAATATEKYEIVLLHSVEICGTFGFLPNRKPTDDEASALNLILSNIVTSNELDQPKLTFKPGEFGQK